MTKNRESDSQNGQELFVKARSKTRRAIRLPRGQANGYRDRILDKFSKTPLNGFYLWVAMWPILSVIGTVLFLLPISTKEGIEVDLIDALFTAISAVTLTGLTVVGTADTWSVFGIVTMLTLFQLGGLGAFAGLAALLSKLGQLTGLRNNQLRRAQGLSIETEQMDLNLWWIVKFMLLSQSVALISIYLNLSIESGQWGVDALWASIFLAISSVNSAGFVHWGQFDEFSDNNGLMLLLSLFTIGGSIGFLVIRDLNLAYRRVLLRYDEYISPRIFIRGVFSRSLLGDTWWRTSLDSKIVLSTSVGLLLVGTVWIFLREYLGGGLLSGQHFLDALIHGFTESSFARSSGFTTIDWSESNMGTLLVFTGLMFVGGASGSVGGGIRLATFGLLAHKFISVLRGDANQALFGRSITDHDFRIALVFATCSILFLMGMVLLVSQTTDAALEDVIFETTSAFSKTGFTTGLTASLSDEGKLLFCISMLVGRIGPLAVLTLFAGDPDRPSTPPTVHYPPESVTLG